jgi:hypothetical protein
MVPVCCGRRSRNEVESNAAAGTRRIWLLLGRSTTCLRRLDRRIWILQPTVRITTSGFRPTCCQCDAQPARPGNGALGRAYSRAVRRSTVRLCRLLCLFLGPHARMRELFSAFFFVSGNNDSAVFLLHEVHYHATQRRILRWRQYATMEALRLLKPTPVQLGRWGTKRGNTLHLADTPWRSLKICRWCVLLRSTEYSMMS